MFYPHESGDLETDKNKEDKSEVKLNDSKCSILTKVGI